MKPVVGIFSAPHCHWVGDGFPVRTLFSYQDLARHISPFLLLDHAAPTEFTPSRRKRGVGQHAHRGFETVTIVYQGELAHRDSSGGGGLIGHGDVQWMTAGSGIVHEEFHSPRFTRTGGTLEMVQLWVNLPRCHKMTAPAYQTVRNADIPVIALPDGAGRLRLIAGSYGQRTGAARTFTDVDVWDVRLHAGKKTSLPLKAGRGAAVVMLGGSALLGAADILSAGQWALLGPAGADVAIDATSDAMLLVLSGNPIDEPVVGQGPFVMNTAEEIAQAIEDLHSGQFGRIAPLSAGPAPQ